MKQIIILTGLIRTGKTTALKDWVEKNPSICGVLTPDIDGERTFVHYPDKTKYQMICDKSAQDAIHIGRYHFHAKSFTIINQLLKEDFNTGQCKWLLIDEIGRLELKNQGLHDAAKHIFDQLKLTDLRIILIVRDTLVKEVVSHYNIEDYQLIKKEALDQLPF